MRKKNGNAKSVEAKQPEVETEVPKDPLSEPIVIPDKVRKMAKELGVDVGAVVDRVSLIQNRILGIEQAIMVMVEGLDKRDEKLKPLVNFAQQIGAQRKAMAQGTPQVPQQAMGGGGGQALLMQLLSAVGGGGASHPMMDKFVNAVVESSIRRTIESESFDRVFREYMVKKMAKEIGEPLTLTTKKETQ